MGSIETKQGWLSPISCKKGGMDLLFYEKNEKKLPFFPISGKMSLNYEEYTPLNQRKETKMC